MSLNVFYSWQSDISNNINRNFIEDALKKAIKEVGKDLQVQRALREDELLLDKDTKDVPGIPPIVDTIFKKISECAIFVPDITFVGKTGKGRLLPNPNVLIEYGWALKEVGHSRIITIINEAYGKPSAENLPFDMRHLRHPLSYSLTEDSNNEERIKVRSKLVKDLTNAINLIVKKGLLDNLISSPGPLPKTPSTIKPSTFLQPGEKIAYSGRFDESVEHLYLPDVQHLFLRIIPTSEVRTIKNSKVALELVRSGTLMPMSADISSWSNARNKYGAYSCSIEDGKVLNLSQLFMNGELWGIDADCIEKQRIMGNYKVDFGFFPCIDFEQTFYKTLINFLDFARMTLKLPLPLKFIAGATDVEGYRMTPPGKRFIGRDRFCGNVVEQHLAFDGTIDNYEDPSQIIIPFFKYVWEECGLTRPDSEVFSF